MTTAFTAAAYFRPLYCGTYADGVESSQRRLLDNHGNPTAPTDFADRVSRMLGTGQDGASLQDANLRRDDALGRTPSTGTGGSQSLQRTGCDSGQTKHPTGGVSQ